MNASLSQLELLAGGQTDEQAATKAPPTRRRRRPFLTYDDRVGLSAMLVGVALIAAAALLL